MSAACLSGSQARPLAGRRILVTRASHQAGALAEALEARGAEVLRLAVIAIAPPLSFAPLDAALAAIRSFDWLILTSANGAAALAGRLRALHLAPAALRHLRVAAIGPATARAARRLGLAVELVPEEYVAEAVVAALRGKVESRRVLLARAAAARDVIPAELARLGAQVEVVEAYRTILPPDALARLPSILGPEAPPLHAVTFTSSSTVVNFFALLGAAAIARPARLPAVSIGPITSRTLRRHHWEPAIQAARYDIPGLVEACERLLAPSR